jgi:hypothetical protein
MIGAQEKLLDNQPNLGKVRQSLQTKQQGRL